MSAIDKIEVGISISMTVLRFEATKMGTRVNSCEGCRKQFASRAGCLFFMFGLFFFSSLVAILGKRKRSFFAPRFEG